MQIGFIKVNVMNKFRKVSALFSALGVLAFASMASATTYNYSFGDKITGGGPALASMATLSFDSSTDIFTLSVSNTLNSVFGSNAFIGTLATDYSGTTPSISNVTGGGVSSVGTSPGGGPSGDFDFRFVFGGGSDKLTQGETVRWTSSNFNISQLDTIVPFGLHIQSTSFNEDQGGNSAWYGVAAVPEPETYAMMLAGLGLMGFIARRRNNLQA